MSFLVVLGAIIFITLWRLNNWSNRNDISLELDEVYLNCDRLKFVFDRVSEHELESEI